jgi:hypothetical protein
VPVVPVLVGELVPGAPEDIEIKYHPPKITTAIITTDQTMLDVFMLIYS